MSESVSVRLEDVTFRYPGSDHAVLDALDLDVAAGERVAVLGPNGSGKTTLGLHLNGLLSPQSGSVRIDGTPVTPATAAAVRRTVGLVFQDSDDQLFMQTVEDDVAFGPANLGIAPPERDQLVDTALRAVDAVHLARRVPHHLSGGEKRRVAIATVLAMRPGLLVLDEPTSGLDPVGRHQLGDLLRSLAHTQIVVTHDLPFALATCPRAVILDHGNIVADRPTGDLLDDAELLARHNLALPFGFARIRT